MSKLLNICLVLFVLVLLFPTAIPVQAATGSGSPQSTLLQFTSGGHVLGFSENGIYAATGDHALKVEFVNGSMVQPVSEVAGNGQNTSTPLDKVTYKNAWKGVNVEYTSTADGIAESTFYLHTPASVDSIRLRYNRQVSLDGQGNLVISFENGNMVESAPFAWQEVDGHRINVQANYIICDEHEIGFALAGCRPGVAVTIDPTLVWNTFLGGNKADGGNAIAVDVAGNVYIAGESNTTWGSPLRAYSGNSDAFVARLNSSGVVVWNTFLGGDERDYSNGIALDRSGNIFVTGTSDTEWGSPVRPFPGGLNQPFVARLSSSGALQWNTFLGGGSWGYGKGIAVDVTGNVYITGDSYGTWGLPVRAYLSNNDAYAAKLDNGGNLLWNTFLGGTENDYGYGITVNAAGNVYVVGESHATWGSPVRAYIQDDAFVAALGNNGALLWNTFLGSNSWDGGKGVAVDAIGNIYVAGYSAAAWGNPVRAYSSNGDAFAAKLDGNGTLIWNTFLGGEDGDAGTAIAMDAGGMIYITGDSAATWGNPVRPFMGGDLDCLVSGLNGSGELKWNTFMGGTDADFGYGVAVDPAGNVYIAGESYGTWGSPVRPYTPGTGSMNNLRDAFAAKILGNAPSITSFTPASGDSKTVVTITGKNFLGATVVSFGNVPTSQYHVDSNTQITAIVGTNATGKVRVTTPAGTAISTTNFNSQIGTTPHGASISGMTATTPQGPVSLPTVSVRSASLSATRIAPGTPITVTADVVNTGTVNGSDSIKVYVNGELENSQGVTVNSGSSTPVTFTVTRNEPGTYSVYVGGASAGSFTVDQFADPNIILYISGALLVFAFIIGVLFILRRRQAQ